MKKNIMRRKIIVALSLLLFSSFCFAQRNNTIDISDEIYPILENLQIRGLVKPMIGQKPYTQRLILEKIDEALNTDKLMKSEKTFLEKWKAEKETPPVMDLKKLFIRKEHISEKFYASFNFNTGFETSASGGLYTKDFFNQWGFDLIVKFGFYGDMTEKFSYKILGYLDLTQMPLFRAPGEDYFIGYSWYKIEKDEHGKDEYIVDSYLRGKKKSDSSKYGEPKRRTVKTFLNTSYLPFSYNRLWDGQMYYLSNLTASGLEGWPQQIGISGGIQGELHYSAFAGHLEIGVGRYRRSYASMEDGASLALNEKARPFLGLDLAFNPFDWIQYSFVVGGLEYPNQDYMNKNAYTENAPVLDDAYFFQNAFTLNMVELNFPYFHFDFGSSVVWPKRSELGYLYPLTSYVEYQNHIGDGDNLALFGDIKASKPGLGSIWASAYLDELNIGSNFFTDTRIMYAGQLGVKAVIPFLPFASVSMRYTKVEPYCYTHQAINYTPWYKQYIWENYTNSGECIGYYTPPNSDEFHFRFEAKPLTFLSAALQYQFIRHGADYGSQQVPGSSLYSELSPWNRENLHKYFLHDGAYNWMHIVSLSGTFTMKEIKVPLQAFGTVGFMYSYYTMIDSAVYKKHYDPYDSSYQKAAGKTTTYSFVDTGEYPVQCGAVLTLGIRLFYW